jgi:hypothetical protein
MSGEPFKLTIRTDTCNDNERTKATERLELCKAWKVSKRLVGSGQAAEAAGVSLTTLLRWVHNGLITPTDKTLGGHFRWDLDDLQRQLEERKNQPKR